MAVVYRAEIDADGRTYMVALKCLLPELARDKVFVRRFIAEARLGQQISHPNIARTHEVGFHDNIHFIALEYVPGVTLLRLFQHAQDTRPMPVWATLHVIAQIARALAHAHDLRDEQGKSLGLIHRDIAPSNIIVADTGIAKLIDFGVAKSTISHVRTGVGEVIGKLGYVAPEYLRTGKLDPRADLYSLGVVAYEMLTARRLFDVQSLRSAEVLRASEIPPPSSLNPQVPPELDRIVMRVLAHDPDERVQTAVDLFTVLDRFAHEAGLASEDRDVAAWIGSELQDMPVAAPTYDTEDIAIDVELGIEEAFARVRAKTGDAG
jgi:eukaryotic-like serine/threonine-protein kinase